MFSAFVPSRFVPEAWVPWLKGSRYDSLRWRWCACANRSGRRGNVFFTLFFFFFFFSPGVRESRGTGVAAAPLSLSSAAAAVAEEEIVCKGVWCLVRYARRGHTVQGCAVFSKVSYASPVVYLVYLVRTCKQGCVFPGSGSR